MKWWKWHQKNKTVKTNQRNKIKWIKTAAVECVVHSARIPLSIIKHLLMITKHSKPTTLFVCVCFCCRHHRSVLFSSIDLAALIFMHIVIAIAKTKQQQKQITFAQMLWSSYEKPTFMQVNDKNADCFRVVEIRWWFERGRQKEQQKDKQKTEFSCCVFGKHANKINAVRICICL